jgi:predicted glycogen debranching enzyme
MLEMTEVQAASKDLPIDPMDIDAMLTKEWLLTNRRGSYVSGTALGCNTRRYHGLLIAALQPPVKRMVTLSNLLETVQVGQANYELANFEFSDRLHPRGFQFLKEFRQDAGVHFRYELPDNLTVEKSIYLDHDHDLVVVNYEFDGPAQTIRFSLMPLLAMRDFHALQSSSASLTTEQTEGAVTARSLDPNGPALHMTCPQAAFQRGPDWWYSVHYRRDRQRGQDDYEDVWAPGVFQAEIQVPGTIHLAAEATSALQRPGPLQVEPRELQQNLQTRRRLLLTQADALDAEEESLVSAADQFVVQRQMQEIHDSTSILAGYHWFADWGRDTFIALPGLLLSTGRYEEAKQVLQTFVSNLNEGMIPNYFDDYGGLPHYNSIDASLWFVNAAYQYLIVSEDKKTYKKDLFPAIAQIIEKYCRGTRFEIHADEDGLISGGNPDTQLTWMDARCNGVSFTPRYGKAVEVNALWINALHIAAETAPLKKDRQRFAEMAQNTCPSFVNLFWNEQTGCLNDCIHPDGSVDAAIRPNQVFAVSLPFSPLNRRQKTSLLAVVEEHLLTPYGLRSLSPLDSRYQPHYCGDQFQRDSAYHQGTVWAWLIGPFAEAYLKVNAFSPHARQQVDEMIRPLLDHLHLDACLSSVSEIFDGDYPHKPHGCIAQAWSVAELLRIKKLLRQP